MSKKKLTMVGYFGWGNFGDELFLEAHKQHLGDTYELSVANDLLKEPYFSRPVKDIVDEVDGTLIGGGDLINPLRVSQLYWRQEFFEKPVFVFGIGVPRQPFERKNVIDVYRRRLQHENTKLVVARDVESYNWLQDNLELGDKLIWTPDSVCSLNRPAPVKNEHKTLGLVMREHRSLDQDMTQVRKLADTAKELGYKVKHLVLATKSLGEADLSRAELIREPDEEIVYSEDLYELCAEIGGCDLLASIKFHGMVVATMYGVPTIAMSVTPKNLNFLRMLERPEMAVSYTDPNLYKRVSWYPAAIPNRTRSYLYRESNRGYQILKETLAKELG